ncbi:MAG: DUF3108 domain-containing protein, partial [candidate division WOR-3 bacterium]
MTCLLLSLVVALPIGERLTYRVKYGPLSAGTLTLALVGIEELRGESCYHLISHLRSNPAYATLFSLNDSIESWTRISDFVTLRTRKHVREGSYECELVADFDPVAGQVSYSDSEQMTTAHDARDLLSLWYYFRTLDLSVGDDFWVTCHVDKKTYDALVSVAGRETV